MIVTGLIPSDLPSEVSPDLDVVLAQAGSVGEVRLNLSGAFTDTQPVDEYPTTTPGHVATGANREFYYRILVEPADTDLGNVTTDAVVPIKVWNGFFSSRVVNDVTYPSDQGIDFSEPYPTPYTIGSLIQVTYTATVRQAGPPRFIVTTTFSVSGADYTSVIRGNRSNMLGFVPEWRDSVVEKLQWKTDILVARDGSEQRVAVRGTPRQAYEYAVQTSGPDTARLRHTLANWLNRPFVFPVWTEETLLTANATIGQFTFSCDTTRRSFYIGGYVALYTDPHKAEIGVIASFTSNSITLVNALTNNWTANLTTVVPAATARLPAQIPVEYITDSVARANLEVQLLPGQSVPYLPSSTPATYNGTEIYTRKPNWRDTRTLDVIFNLNTVDYGYGRLGYAVTDTLAKPVQTYNYMVSGRDEIDDLRAFIARRRGRQAVCYLPSFNSDFTLAAPVTPSASSISVTDNGYAIYNSIAAGTDHIGILHNGAWYFRQITGAVVSGSAVTLGLSGTSGGALPEITNLNTLICFVKKCRLATDEVLLEWRTDSVVECTLNFAEVKA